MNVPGGANGDGSATDGLLPPMVHVPAGPFLMGSSDDDTYAWPVERPQHTLSLPDFWIGRTRITNGQFRPFVDGDGYTNPAYWTREGWTWRTELLVTAPDIWPPKAPEHRSPDVLPVSGITWFEAVAYVRWLSARIGAELRLPTEAEWEKAARGPDGRRWPWGDDPDQSRKAMTREHDPVGHNPGTASPYGVQDMASMTGDWCTTTAARSWLQGTCHPYPYQLQDEWSPDYLEGKLPRVVRGYGWGGGVREIRATWRMAFRPYSTLSVGIRIVSALPPPAAAGDSTGLS